MIAQLDKKYIKTRPKKVWSRLISYVLFEGRPVTTRGQWINPIVFSLFKLWRAIPQLKKVEKPIFIIGTGRSGTTLLGKILSMHKEVSFLNEPKALWHEIFSEEDLIGSYSLGQAYYELDERYVDSEIEKRAHKLFSAYLTLSGGERIVDKYPELIFRVPFVKEIFPDAKFLFITRNGEDTLQSIDKWSDHFSEKRGGDVHDWWGVNDRKWLLLCEQIVSESELLRDYQKEILSFENHKDRAAVEWILTMERGLNIKTNYNDSVFMLKYEDLLSDPVRVLELIEKFAGLCEDRKLIKYAKEVIGKPAPKKNVVINSLIKPAFSQTMNKFNYKS